MVRERLAFGVWMLAAACTGCGNGDAGAAAPRAGGGAETRDTDGVRTDDAPYAQPAPWPEMDMAQRLQFMQQVVMPEMRARFQEYDPEHYADFDCTTCHGDIRRPDSVPARLEESSQFDEVHPPNVP